MNGKPDIVVYKKDQFSAGCSKCPVSSVRHPRLRLHHTAVPRVRYHLGSLIRRSVIDHDNFRLHVVWHGNRSQGDQGLTQIGRSIAGAEENGNLPRHDMECTLWSELKSEQVNWAVVS